MPLLPLSQSTYTDTILWRKRLTRGFACILLLPFLLAPWWAVSYYQIDFQLFHQLMVSRYGQAREPASRQWETMLYNLNALSERDRVLRVNQFFHQQLRYKSDMALWGVEDYWATPLETLGKGMGDCEDYAIAKYVSLRYAGISDQKLRLIYVRARVGGPQSKTSVAHMVLGYYATPDAEPLILDSLVASVVPASERPDLSPVFSFNSEGLWTGQQASGPSAANPTARLSRWRDVLERMQQEGIVWQQ